MADVISRLRLDSGEFDSKIKRAGQEIMAYSEHCRKMGLEMGYANKDAKDFAKALGNMETTSSSARGKINELSEAFVNLKVMYKNMTDEERNNTFGKSLAASLDNLKTRIQEAKRDLADVTSELNGKSSANGGFLSGIGSKMEGALAVFGGNLMTKAAGIGVGLVTEMTDAVKQGIELAKAGEGVRIAFERLGRGDILQGLREATHGTVTDLELMKAAVKFNDFKLPVEELGTMLAFAQQKAKDTGQSVDYMVDSIVTGLGRKSLMILDNLGLSAAQIKERMAETGDMTKAVGAIIREQMASAGEYVETAADRAAQANVSLQNKMEELGRKFAPVEEASNQLWTSMKIGILDIVGGPLAKLLNGLTEAGRLKNMLNQVNGGGDNGQQSQVDKQLAKLRVAQSAGSKYMTNSLYTEQMEQYNRQINTAQNLRDQYKKAGMFGGGLILSDISRQFKVKVNGLEDIDNLISSLQTVKSEYEKGAKAIMNPIKPTVDTSDAVQSLETLKVKLAELQAQRKKAIENKDTELSATLLKQINQVKADIKGLDPNALKTGGTNPVKQAQEKVANALHEHEQAIETAKMSLDNGTSTEAEYKKKLLAAEERLWNAYGDAYNIVKDPKYKEAQDATAAEIKKLGGEVTASIEAQKKAQEAARELESAQKKLADAEREATEALSRGDLKAYNTATAKAGAARATVERMGGSTNSTATTVSIRPKIVDAVMQSIPAEIQKKIGSVAVPMSFPLTDNNLQAFIASLKERISNAEVGSELYNNLTKQLADANMLGSFISLAIENGIDASVIKPDKLWKKIFGENPGDYIDDKFWENLGDKFSEALGKGISVDTNTGKVKDKDSDNGFNSTITTLSKTISGLSSITSGLEGMGIDLGSDITEAIGWMQSLISVIQGVSTVISVFSNVSQTANTAALGVNTASIVSLEAAIWANTAASFFPFANGGIVPHAANGYFVGGTHMSGDVTPIMANAGELVLNKAQQGNLASILQDGGLQNLNLSATISGEQIRLVLNNNGRRTGRGEYVQTNFR